MARYQSPDENERASFSSSDGTPLQDLLPPNQQLQFNEEDRIISLMSIEPPQIIAQFRLSKSEWPILGTLRKWHPYYAPYEELLACLTSLPLTECQKRLREAQKAGPREFNRELKPVRQAIWGIRKKLKHSMPFLKISSTPDSGYGLTSLIAPDCS